MARHFEPIGGINPTDHWRKIGFDLSGRYYDLRGGMLGLAVCYAPLSGVDSSGKGRPLRQLFTQGQGRPSFIWDVFVEDFFTFTVYRDEVCPFIIE